MSTFRLKFKQSVKLEMSFDLNEMLRVFRLLSVDPENFGLVQIFYFFLLQKNLFFRGKNKEVLSVFSLNFRSFICFLFFLLKKSAFLFWLKMKKKSIHFFIVKRGSFVCL